MTIGFKIARAVAKRDLRAALEVGLSMSSRQFSNSRGMDSKVCINLKVVFFSHSC